MTPCCPHCGSIATKAVSPKARECLRCGQRGSIEAFTPRAVDVDLSNRDVLTFGTYRKKPMFLED